MATGLGAAVAELWPRSSYADALCRHAYLWHIGAGRCVAFALWFGRRVSPPACGIRAGVEASG